LSRLIPADTDTDSSTSLSSDPATVKSSSESVSATLYGYLSGPQSAGLPSSDSAGAGLVSKAQAEKQISYSWFGQFFKQAKVAVSFDTSGLTLTSLNQNRFFTNERFTKCENASGDRLPITRTTDKTKEDIDEDKETKLYFNWQQLDKPSVFNWSFLGYLLSFSVNGLIYSTPFLSYTSKSQFSNDIHEHWALANQQGLCELVARVETAITCEYLRQSRLKKISARVAREYSRWFPWSKDPSLNLTVETQTALSKLQQFKGWTETDVNNIREQYVQQQLLRHKAFFDNVESNPLTDKQRRACVIDDDNNLLLAGAGTGKTSVMVGRAGYMIESGQANSSEILLLAYGKVAAKEMEERIMLKLAPRLDVHQKSQGQLSVNEIRVSTFHSLGMRIIAEVEGATPKLSHWINDEKIKECWLNETLESLLKEKRYRKRLLAFFSEHFQVERSPFDFESEKACTDYFTANAIRSFKGDKVKSFGELQIANWLYKQGIEYRYQDHDQYKMLDKKGCQSKSSFYLPQDDLYIDYFDIDETGSAPTFVDNDSYLASIDRMRELHRQNNTHYIDLYHHQHNQGVLLKQLSKALVKCRVKRAPIDDETLLSLLRHSGDFTKLVKLFNQVLTLYRGACLDDKSLAELISCSAEQQQTQAAFTLLKPMLKSYRNHLNSSGEIDFEEMIARAIKYIEQGRFVSPWRFIMIDEFQDISEPRARLIRALRDSTHRVSKEKPVEDTKSDAGFKDKGPTPKSTRSPSLFCVGDDWQAIYRFSGADVRLTTDFERYFGPVTESQLDLTFRFNSRIGDIATRFITKNPMQIKKTIHSVTKGGRSAVSIVKAKAVNKQSTEMSEQGQLKPCTLTETLNAIAELVGKRKSKAGDKPTVYLLGRYWFLLPEQEELALLNKACPAINIECHSFHGSKGKEADYVIIMGLTTGIYGFPSQKTTPPMLDVLLPEAEDFNFAEERRLLYVALTRAKHKVYLLADKKDVSPFVDEIAQLCKSQV